MMNDAPNEDAADTAAVTDQQQDSLTAALGRAQIELDEQQIAELDRYVQRLWDWNTRLNLTRHTTYEKFVRRDLVDVMQIEPFIDSAERVLDVGSGGGVPGVPLAILRPDLEIELCDSVAKKARALEAIVSEAGLKIPVHHAPAQQLVEGWQRYDTLVIRAVAALPKLLGWFKPHWDNFGRLLLIKGPGYREERAAARDQHLMHGLRLNKLASYPLPDTDSESVILEIRPKD